MFDGEMASLDALLKTETIKVPKPVKVIELDTGGSAFVMEHLDMKGLTKWESWCEPIASLNNRRNVFGFWSQCVHTVCVHVCVSVQKVLDTAWREIGRSAPSQQETAR